MHTNRQRGTVIVYVSMPAFITVGAYERAVAAVFFLLLRSLGEPEGIHNYATHSNTPATAELTHTH